MLIGSQYSPGFPSFMTQHPVKNKNHDLTDEYQILAEKAEFFLKPGIIFHFNLSLKCYICCFNKVGIN